MEADAPRPPDVIEDAVGRLPQAVEDSAVLLTVAKLR